MVQRVIVLVLQQDGTRVWCEPDSQRQLHAHDLANAARAAGHQAWVILAAVYQEEDQPLPPAQEVFVRPSGQASTIAADLARRSATRLSAAPRRFKRR